jgi:threonine dehydrogenase-like Zn-dependent dehydrogenase
VDDQDRHIDLLEIRSPVVQWWNPLKAICQNGVTMEKVMAAVMPGPKLPIEVREFARPSLEPNSALLDVSLSEVCGTDVHLHAGHLASVPYPIIPGHVSVGTLANIRGTLSDVHGRQLREGDSVTFLDVHRTCGYCWYCSVAKASTRCPERKVYGVTYGVADGIAGGWAESLYLKPNTRCLALSGVSGERFMAGGCSLPTALHAGARAEISLGDIVLVLGSGPVGLSIIICSLLQGAQKVLCIGGPEVRLMTAMKVGAHATLNFSTCTEPEQIDWVRQHTQGRGADITLEATGDPRAAVNAMRCTRDAGRVVIVGQYTDMGEVSFNPHLDINMKHLDVRGCWGSDFSHFYRAVQLMSDPEISRRWSAIPLRRYGLHEAGAALASVADGEAHKALINPGIQKDSEHSR